MLAQLIDQRFDTRGDFARHLGVSSDVVSQLCRGITRLTGERRTKAARLLGVEESSLKGQRADTKPKEETRDNEVANLGANKPAKRVGFKIVPIYGSVPAGNPACSYSDAIDVIEMPEWGGDFNRWGRVIIGNSMEPEFLDGDVAIFEDRSANTGPDFGHGVHARNVAENEDTFKVLRKHKDGSSELWPLNPDYDAFSAEGWEILGVCIRRIRVGERGIEDERKYPAGFIHHWRR